MVFIRRTTPESNSGLLSKLSRVTYHFEHSGRTNCVILLFHIMCVEMYILYQLHVVIYIARRTYNIFRRTVMVMFDAQVYYCHKYVYYHKTAQARWCQCVLCEITHESTIYMIMAKRSAPKWKWKLNNSRGLTR